jgi:predicted transposase YbfD/YdcC
MDHEKYTTLMQVFQGIPDPRKARGKRYPWLYLLALIGAALASGQKTAHAIAHWVMLHGPELLEHLCPPRSSIPSESTIRRTLHGIDISILEKRLTGLAQYLAATGPKQGTVKTEAGQMLQGQALDGKELRGVRAHGQKLHLLSLVQHESGRTLTQMSVETKTNEITAAPELLRGRDLSGTVTTMDALLTQRPFAQQILDQKGHYLMVVKRNQGNLYDAIALLFDDPPWLPREKEAECQVHHSVEKGHGRLEKRTLESSQTLSDYVDWPSVGQVMRRRYERIRLKTGEVSAATTYGITSLPHTEVGAAGLAQLWRGHWTIENRVHYVRDVTMGEDANQTRTGNAPHVLAALRNAILNLFRHHGWSNIADAFRHHNASVRRTLALIGAVSNGL